ncbi:MAG: hypothetical protein AW11_01351 [Candidatus Accumulibacter regalis]|uniref:Uncharacterized protein n=1 Tax=Accumulibacter regalis TaxID=522306 RepID=A0A011P3Z0_ACCRE|nr:MAG: hypothetical protein AW11_01351 [Candidatus Accumulibacter regalis]
MSDRIVRDDAIEAQSIAAMQYGSRARPERDGVRSVVNGSGLERGECCGVAGIRIESVFGPRSSSCAKVDGLAVLCIRLAERQPDPARIIRIEDGIVGLAMLQTTDLIGRLCVAILPVRLIVSGPGTFVGTEGRRDAFLRRLPGGQHVVVQLLQLVPGARIACLDGVSVEQTAIYHFDPHIPWCAGLVQV